MTTKQEAEAEYRSGMERSAEAVRDLARTHNALSMWPDTLARAVVLCAPYVRYRSTGDDELTRQLHLDYLAGMEYGGYHGFDYERIQDECEWIACFYHDEIAEASKS